jgi:hypothetical protein
MRFFERRTRERLEASLGNRVLESIATTQRASVDDSNGVYHPGRHATLRIRGQKVSWSTNGDLHYLGMRTPKVAVSVHLGKTHDLFAVPDLAIGGVQAYVPGTTIPVPWYHQARAWLRTPASVDLVERLALVAGEWMEVDPGWSLAQLRVQGLPADLERAEIVVEIIESVTDPSAPWIRVSRVPKEALPETFRDLAPLLRRWAISDDSVRSERMERTTTRTLQRLVDTVSPRLPAIGDYVHAEDAPTTEPRDMLMWLAIATEEAQLELDRRRSSR